MIIGFAVKLYLEHDDYIVIKLHNEYIYCSRIISD